jgi:hypothetical protein
VTRRSARPARGDVLLDQAAENGCGSAMPVAVSRALFTTRRVVACATRADRYTEG